MSQSLTNVLFELVFFR
uniref:Uncharacterized protein n=1 Tax=Arundo donax TaxID=35708 RepID=A0A0A8YQ20_ARUDO